MDRQHKQTKSRKPPGDGQKPQDYGLSGCSADPIEGFAVEPERSEVPLRKALRTLSASLCAALLTLVHLISAGLDRQRQRRIDDQDRRQIRSIIESISWRSLNGTSEFHQVQRRQSIIDVKAGVDRYIVPCKLHAEAFPGKVDTTFPSGKAYQ